MEDLYGSLYASRVWIPAWNPIICITAHSIKSPTLLAAIFRCPAPQQLHIAQFCPQQLCCGLFCVFEVSLPFSTSVNLKFPHFKFTEVFYVLQHEGQRSADS